VSQVRVQREAAAAEVLHDVVARARSNDPGTGRRRLPSTIEDALDNFDAIHSTPQRAFEAGGETAYFVVNGVVRVAEEIRDALGIG
jgi:hypothetical protein